MVQRTEVLVIGGGPAGLAAGIAARLKGFEVTVADGAKPPIDKACGEGLMPQTAMALRELGVSIHPSEGRKFQGIRFIDGTTSFEARFPTMAGLGVRRTVLHQRMVARAMECEVSLLWNSPVSSLSVGGAIVGGKMIQAEWIVGADGVRTRVQRWIGLDSGGQKNVRFAHSRHYRLQPWTDCVEIHWGQQSQVYVTPISAEETCVVLISRDPRVRFEDVWREYPELANRLMGARVSSPDRGAVTAMRRLDRVYQGNVVLMGDASGSVDAITGEGLSLSFGQARALADAMEAGDLSRYQVAHRHLQRKPFLLSRLLLFMEKNPQLRTRVLGAFGRDPGLFPRVLATPVQEKSGLHVVSAAARFGWQFLTA